VRKGECVTLIGRWKDDPKYGRQFRAESLRYDLPDSPEGLVQYLAKHPAFFGIGEALARKIVGCASSVADLDALIRQGIDDLYRQLRIPRRMLESLRDAWIAHSEENEIRSYLAGFSLTHLQMETLLEIFGSSVVGLLRTNPYELIRYVRGYGFKKVDKIARALGTPKDHPGRLEAGLQYVLDEEISSGHTWSSGSDLLSKANDLLRLDTLDSREMIQAAGVRLLVQGQWVADGCAVSTPLLLEAEQLIHSVFERHGWEQRPFAGVAQQLAGLRPKQIEAYLTALQYGITVISGGAGTGKSYVLARLAKSLQHAGSTVALCSPTGKAAKRIEELLRDQGVSLRAKTIHRLLEYDGHRFHRPSLSRPSVGRDGSLAERDPAYDVVVVDEVSMVDVSLMASSCGGSTSGESS
jgi:exodeoxyribonuclease V alpha subunit